MPPSSPRRHRSETAGLVLDKSRRVCEPATSAAWVLPAPFAAPSGRFFSPRTTLAEKAGNHLQILIGNFSTLRISKPGGVPKFRFISNLMYGRWMLLLARFQRSASVRTSFLREVACRGSRARGKTSRLNSCQLRDFFFLAVGVVRFDASAKSASWPTPYRRTRRRT